MFVVQMVSYHGYPQELVGPFASRAEAAAWAGLQPQARVGSIKQMVAPDDLGTRPVVVAASAHDTVVVAGDES